MSKYDNITTATELVREVMAHGLSTEQEDICRAQDIFGRASVGELAQLANDIGRNNENGEPDPKGTWSSGRKATRDTFYSIAFSIWNWEDACRFWNQHTNPQTEQYNEIRAEASRLADKNKALATRCEELLKNEGDWRQLCSEEKQYRTEIEQELRAAQTQILRLKAQLFDLLYKE